MELQSISWSSMMLRTTIQSTIVELEQTCSDITDSFGFDVFSLFGIFSKYESQP